MRSVLSIVLASVLTFPAGPAFAAAAPARALGASLAGTASNSAGQAVANVTVPLRNLATGQLAGTTQSSATGAFNFAGLAAGNYSVEIVNSAGQIIGSSAAIPVAAGAKITGVSVTTSATQAAAGGTASHSTAIIITTAVVGAGIAAIVAIKTSGSPSQ